MSGLTRYADSLRLADETDAQLLERLRANSRGAPQKPDESEASYFRRLVWNVYQGRYMKQSEAGKRTTIKRRETLREVRGTDDPRAQSEKRRAKRKAEKRSAEIADMKRAPCMDCGGTFPPVCMDFDHRDPSTKDRSRKGITGPGRFGRVASWDRFLAEIAKCDLVCANCHRIRTEARRIDPGGPGSGG